MTVNVKTKIIPLSEIEADSKVRIVSFTGGTKFRDKLLCQGIIPGQEVEVQNSGGAKYPVILKINDSKIMIGCGMTAKILVEPIIK